MTACGSPWGAADCAEATKISIKPLGTWQNARQHLPHNILIVTDAPGDAEHLTATLRVLVGYNVPIRRASSLDAALSSLAEHHPAYVFIVEMGCPSIDAKCSTAELRRAGYDGPVIVVCNDGSHASRTRLVAGGANDVIHKDDVCSARIAEAFGRALKRKKVSPFIRLRDARVRQHWPLAIFACGPLSHTLYPSTFCCFILHEVHLAH